MFSLDREPRDAAGARNTVLLVGGMETSACVRRIDTALRAVPGVETCGVNLLTRLATVRHEARVEPAALAEAIRVAGFCAAPAAGSVSSAKTLSDQLPERRVSRSRARFLTCASLTVLLLLATTLKTRDAAMLILLLVLATPIQFAIGGRYLRNAFSEIWNGRCSLLSLAAFGALCAYVQGALCFVGEVTTDPELVLWTPQFHAGALILTLVTLGEWLAAKAEDSAERVCDSIEALLPREASVLRNGREVAIPINAIKPGDVVLVGANERIPVDGEVLEGYSHIHETPLARGANPISKIRGDRVMAASLNGSGCLQLRATGIGAQSTLAHISLLVSRARARRGSSSGMLSARLGTPLMYGALIAGALTFALWRWGAPGLALLHSAQLVPQTLMNFLREQHVSFLLTAQTSVSALHTTLAVLIVAFPSAVAVALSAAWLAAARSFSRRGILLRDGGAIDQAARTTDVVFLSDTTLARAVPRVREIVPAAGMDANQVLALAASIAAKSSERAGRAIEREARTRGIAVPLCEDLERSGSDALHAHIGAQEFWLTTPEFLATTGLSGRDGSRDTCAAVRAKIALAKSQGADVRVLVRTGGDILGAMILEERVKDDARGAIAALRSQGVSVHLISHAPLNQVCALGHACGLSENEVHALGRTESKAELVAALTARGRQVAAIGSTGSDAPALAASSVGIGLGVDCGPVMDAANIVLLSQDAMGVGKLIARARQAQKLLRQNVWLALLPLSVSVPLTIFGKVSAFGGVCIGACAVVPVVLNCLRFTAARRIATVATLKETQVLAPVKA